MELQPIYILILACVGMLTAALTVLKIFKMKRSPEGARYTAYGQIETTVKLMEQKISRKRDIPFCDERHDNLQRELTKGQKQFEAILVVQSGQADILARIEERVSFLAVEQGFGKREK